MQQTTQTDLKGINLTEKANLKVLISVLFRLYTTFEMAKLEI